MDRIGMERVFAVLALLLLAACLPDPRLRADNEDRFAASLASATRSLNPATREKLDSALHDIVLARLEPGRPAAEAMAERLAADPLGVDAKFAREWAARRAALVVKHARDVVEGRTAREVIAFAERERRSAVQAALALQREQLARAKAAFSAVQSAADAGLRVEHRGLLQRIAIAKARFSLEELGMLEQPTISFVIANKGTIPVKRIFVHGTMQAPGRDSPLVAANLAYVFPTELRPGETRELSLTPNMFSEWGTVPREALKGATLSLSLAAFEDTAERRYGEVASERGGPTSDAKALADAIMALEKRIRALEALAQGGS
jgi:hypothetical protein